ncbi:MAG: corrinoid protein [Oscillospiraceae bacterium]|nr:corrinoid protein [Oscillospiraceae bacterium]
MSKLQEISAAVEKGKKKLIGGLVQEALDEGIAPSVILNEGMVAAMGKVGEAFTNGDIFVPEMLVAARAMKAGVEVLKPHLASGEAGALGKIILGTVSGDLHDIGKNLVGMMFESAGFEVIDLGVDVPDEKFLETYDANPDTKIIALSALLTTTMPSLESVVAKLNATPFRGKIKIMVGGAPVTQKFADKIGADAYTPDAGSAAEKAKELVS